MASQIGQASLTPDGAGRHCGTVRCGGRPTVTRPLPSSEFSGPPGPRGPARRVGLYRTSRR
eukprot:42171-Hanusia_phi.AAC.1